MDLSCAPCRACSSLSFFGCCCPYQPLWLGGTVGESGLSFLHTYPEVKGAKPLMEEEGIFFGGDIESASRVVTEGPGSGFNFRFFVQVCVTCRACDI